MSELQLTILTQEDLKRRYDKLNDTNMARLTDEAIAGGYSIGILQYAGLKHNTARDWLDYAKVAVAMNFKGHIYKIGVFTDLSEVDEDKVYFAYKTKEGVRSAHSVSPDPEGFV